MTTKATTAPPQTTSDPWCQCGYRRSAHLGDARRCPTAGPLMCLDGKTRYALHQVNDGRFLHSYGLNQPVR